MKVHENAEVVKINLDRRAFTKHGQHMNAMGKELMAKRIIEAIKHTLKVCKRTLIFMKWKEDTKTSKTQEKLKLELGKDETPQKTRMIFVQAEESNSTQQEKETVVIASRRNQKTPVTRRDDFLWTGTSKRQAR